MFEHARKPIASSDVLHVTQDQKLPDCAIPLHQPNAVSLAGASLSGHVTSKILQAPPQQAGGAAAENWRSICCATLPARIVLLTVTVRPVSGTAACLQ